MGERYVCKAVGVKPVGKKSLGKTKRRWDGNNEIDLQKFGFGGMHWTELS
jgi:hypothetical protein